MPQPAHLTITQKDAKEAFRILRRLCKPKKGEEAVLSYDGACLHIECAGVTVAPGAVGEWNYQVRVYGHSLMGLVKMPPSADPLEFTSDGANLTVSGVSISCACQQPWTKKIELPVNYTLEDVYALGQQYSEQEIIESGLGELYKRAVKEAPNRARNGTFKRFAEDPRQMHFLD